MTQKDERTNTNGLPEDEKIESAEAQTDETGATEDESPAEADPTARIAELEAEVEKLKAEYMRALADAQNAKRMADKRIEDNSKYAVSNFAKELLSVADNLGRALSAAPPEAREQNDMVNTLAVGVEMTEKELYTALGKYGVRKIDSQDKPFDPHLHQAMQEVERPDVPQGTVVQVYQDGYTIHDRLLRPAMVAVSRGGPKREPESAEQGGDDAAQSGVDKTV